MDSSVSGQGPVVGCCEQSNELSGFLGGGGFLNQLRDAEHLKAGSALWSLFGINHCRSFQPTFQLRRAIIMLFAMLSVQRTQMHQMYKLRLLLGLMGGVDICTPHTHSKVRWDSKGWPQSGVNMAPCRICC